MTVIRKLNNSSGRHGTIAPETEPCNFSNLSPRWRTRVRQSLLKREGRRIPLFKGNTSFALRRAHHRSYLCGVPANVVIRLIAFSLSSASLCFFFFLPSERATTNYLLHTPQSRKCQFLIPARTQPPKLAVKRFREAHTLRWDRTFCPIAWKN